MAFISTCRMITLVCRVRDTTFKVVKHRQMSFDYGCQVSMLCRLSTDFDCDRWKQEQLPDAYCCVDCGLPCHSTTHTHKHNTGLVSMILHCVIVNTVE